MDENNQEVQETEVILTQGAVEQLIENIKSADNNILQNAKTYADSLASDYDPAGAATTAENNAKDYADSLASNYDASGAASAAEAAAKDYADSLASNYATDEQGEKADSAIQSITTGTSNGTISVDGSLVSVYGLDSAAYTKSTDYDIAGAAATVQAASEPKKITGVLRIPFTASATSVTNIIKYYTTLTNATDDTSPQNFPENFGSKTIIISPANDTAWTMWRDNGIRCSGQTDVTNNTGGLTFSLDDAFSSATTTYANIIIFD